MAGLVETLQTIRERSYARVCGRAQPSRALWERWRGNRPSVPPVEFSVSQLRSALEPFRAKRNWLALSLFAFDFGLFGLGQYLAVGGEGWLRVMGAVLTWLAIVRLFVIGHDACHQALTGNPKLNEFIGRAAFLVSLTPYSLWRVGHNVVHHGFNNLRGRDFIWEPKEVREYLAQPRWRRAVERLYRSALGPAPYYFVEIWWKRLFFPNRRQMPSVRAEFILDSFLVALAASIWIAVIHGYTLSHERAFAQALLAGFLGPFLVWNWTIGVVVYLHHTHPDLRWYGNRREWQRDLAQISATAHIIMPKPLGAALHYIMEHPAHHLNATIPLYNLAAAQRRLQAMGARFTSTRLTVRHYLRCVRSCKLYDYREKRWLEFPQAPHGKPA